MLGYGVHFARGDLDPAIDALREAADLVPGAIRTRAGVQTFLADALVAAGRLDDAEAVLRDELGVARRLRDDRLLAYHAWMQASIASARRIGFGVAHLTPLTPGSAERSAIPRVPMASLRR